MKFIFKSLVVGVVAVFLTALGIDASDTYRGSQETLLSQWLSVSSCEAGMTEVVSPSGRFCVDIYEASPGPGCLVGNPTSLQGTFNNLAEPDCEPVSEPGVMPWVFVTIEQARQLCARTGKRLPHMEEWYEAALGTADNQDVCNLVGDRARTGNSTLCRSGVGTYDMVGNVWEYVVAADALPPSGYVTATINGTPRETSSVPQLAFNNDYVWSKEAEAPVLVRGGFYGAGDDGGLYSIQGTLTSDFSSAAIGFRCVKDL